MSKTFDNENAQRHFLYVKVAVLVVFVHCLSLFQRRVPPAVLEAVPPRFALSLAHVKADQLTAHGAFTYKQMTPPLSETKHDLNEAGLATPYECLMTKSRHLLGKLSSASLKLYMPKVPRTSKCSIVTKVQIDDAATWIGNDDNDF